MLTRLKVTGFKNLVDVDVHFGPFTCIAGPNGVGKSNLFDAIRFLSATASQMSLTEAAMSVRDEEQHAGSVPDIFHRVGGHTAETISFEAEILLPRSGHDYLGKAVEAHSTWVRYALQLGYRKGEAAGRETGVLEVLSEELTPLDSSKWRHQVSFPQSVAWQESVLVGRKVKQLIATEEKEEVRLVRLYQEGRQGRAFNTPAREMPRTVLSTVQTAEYPTVVLARRELESWRFLQLESSALRRPDSFTAPKRMGADGAHLPATLYHLARQARAGSDGETEADREAAAVALYAHLANRLAGLIDDVRSISVEPDKGREVFTLMLTGRDGTVHPASALSDGTLRFLALGVAELDRQAGGLICLEEPENGIHPRRIPAMLQLLQDIAADTEAVCDDENPLRQVIVNTHSPSVVLQVPDDTLLVAELVEDLWRPQADPAAQPLRFRKLQFSCPAGTWRTRTRKEHRITGKGLLLAYLNPPAAERGERPSRKRVMDRDDLQMLLPIPSSASG
ncbi:MAG: AAA family ATPase [Verrucomicrobia bacterium]|nr:AAA family ATPase [Verrucomicrobiota bacterium]